MLSGIVQQLRIGGVICALPANGGHMRNIQKRFVMLLLAVSAMLPIAVLASRASMQADANRKVIFAFYERFFNLHDLTAADPYIAEVYIQHNPNVPNGREAFVEGFTRVFAQFPQRHGQIVRAIAEGDLVVRHVHMTKSPEDRGAAVVDIFRVDHGRIVEHWDVQQAVPAQASNNNTMF
jgi:predicted SnoaL-like aldol condensation-catalyzing enzyme